MSLRRYQTSSDRAPLLALACVLLDLSLAVDDLDFLSVLQQRRSLRKFASLISTHSALLGNITAGNVTVLASTNEAFGAYFSSQAETDNEILWDDVDALLSYHIVHGVHSRGFVDQEPEFLHTLLTDPRYNNVTGGQVVEIARNDEDECVFRAAVNCEAKHVEGEADLVFLGGVVHVIDTVLTPPLAVLNTVTSAPLSHFIDLMSLAVLNANFSPLITNITTTPSTTHFLVDDADVSSRAAEIVSSPEEVVRFIEYNHVPGQALYSPMLTNGSTFRTGAGVDVTITTGVDGTIWVNDAKVIRRDLLVSNGVVHVVDKVLDASRLDARPNPAEVAAMQPTESLHGPSSSDLPKVAITSIIVGVVLVTIIALIGAIIVHFRKGRQPKVEGHNLTGGPKVVSPGRRPYQSGNSTTSEIHELVSRRSWTVHEMAG